ncbi:hypothetical protein ANCDUO_02094 [Ancylostoma duodenale]|uniref:Uncharacterized protein n=1 Tax=Ancylostoma duodenale TaxID=51022 RepID=A0A0C2DXB0_9BILA|nr:hypothetical protein ANCDUO_02094 [Ancylostoma duodenale]
MASEDQESGSRQRTGQTLKKKKILIIIEDVLMLSNGFTEVGRLNWYLGICVLLSWIAVVYVVVVLPFIIMVALLTRLLTLEGSYVALRHFLRPDWCVLKNLTGPLYGFFRTKMCDPPL